MAKELSKDKKTEKAVEALARDIGREKVPQKLLDLAKELQAALDAREKKET